MRRPAAHLHVAVAQTISIREKLTKHQLCILSFGCVSPDQVAQGTMPVFAPDGTRAKAREIVKRFRKKNLLTRRVGLEAHTKSSAAICR